MTTYIAKKAGLKLFEKHLQQYEPVDPLYEIYTDENGRQRRRKVRPSTAVPGRFHARFITMTGNSVVSSVKFLLVYRNGTPASSGPSKGAPITSTPASIYVVSGLDGRSLWVRWDTFPSQ